MSITLLLRRHAPTIGAYTLAAALFIVGVAWRTSFASSSSIAQLLAFASFIGFVALGQAVVVLAGGFDLSVPWLVGLGGVVVARLAGSGVPGPLAIVILLAIGAGIGLVNGLGVTVLRISPIVMTLGVGGLIEAYLLSIGLGQASGTAVPHLATSIASAKVAPGLPVLALIWLGIAIIAGRMLSSTAYGQRLYAVGTNDRAARIAGIRVVRVRTYTYMISGAASVFAGVVLAGYLNQAYMTMGAPYLFASIAAVAVGGASILGGAGTYWGAVAGALTLTFLQALLPMFKLGASTLDIIYGIVILLGVALARAASSLAQRSTFKEDQ